MPEAVEDMTWSHVDSPVEEGSTQWVESSTSLLSTGSSSFSLGSDDCSPCVLRRHGALRDHRQVSSPLEEERNPATDLKARRRGNPRLPPLISSASGLRRSVSASEALTSLNASSLPNSPAMRLGQPSARLMAKSTYDLDQRFSVLTICMQSPKPQAPLDGPEEVPAASTFAGDISGEDLKPQRTSCVPSTSTPTEFHVAPRRRRSTGASSPGFHRHSIGSHPNLRKSRSTGDSTAENLRDLATRLPRIVSKGAVSVNRSIRKSKSTSCSPINSTESSPMSSPALELKQTFIRQSSTSLRRSASPMFSPLASPVFEEPPTDFPSPPKPTIAFAPNSNDIRSRLSSSASTHLSVPTADDFYRRDSRNSPSPLLSSGQSDEGSICDVAELV